MLKRSLALMTLASSILATEATLPEGRIETLNADYVSPKGTGNAEFINIKDFGVFEKPALEVENYNGLLVFSVEDQTFELDLSLLGVTDAETINLRGLNFLNKDKTINLNLSNAHAKDIDLDTSLSRAAIDCTREDHHQDITDDLLSACLKNSRISAKDFRFRSGESLFESLVEEKMLSDQMTLDDLSVSISNHKLKANFKSNLSKGVKVKIEGSTSYNLDERKIVIKIDKAKASFLNIKNKIFDELGKMQNEKIEVNKPFIHIYLE